MIKPRQFVCTLLWAVLWAVPSTDAFNVFRTYRLTVPKRCHSIKTRMLSMSEPAPPPPGPDEKPKKPPPVVPLPTVGEGKDQMDVISRLLKNRILLLGDEVNMKSRTFWWRSSSIWPTRIRNPILPCTSILQADQSLQAWLSTIRCNSCLVTFVRFASVWLPPWALFFWVLELQANAHLFRMRES